MPEIAILLILILLSAFFSGVELATMSLSLLKVRTFVKLKKPGATSLYRIKRNPHRLLIAILIGNNLANIGAASLATVVATDVFGSAGAGIATGVMTFLVLVFGEITPKSIAVQHGEKISLFVGRPLEILIFVLLPLVILFEYMTRFLSRFKKKGKRALTEEELRAIVSISREEGVLDREAMEMIHSVLDFEETKVSKILTPRRWIIMLDENLLIKDAVKKISNYPYDRFPIYRLNEDNVVGVIDNYDIIKNLNKRSKRLKDIAIKPLFVSKDSYIDSVLLKFKSKGRKMAIVLDNNKKVVGIVTIQDVVEEITGDIFEKEVYKQRSGLT
jgi:Mg2+/Co2+ transporter CorB